MVKTALEIRDQIFRSARSQGAQRGRTLKQFVTDAVQEKLSASIQEVGAPSWMKYFGAPKGMETAIRKIDAAIEEKFEKIEPEIGLLS